MEDQNKRYQRQLLLPGFGEIAQQKLQSAKVFVAGAGGLGCPALQYLAAAGVGTIGIADHDSVEWTNLNRQIIYTPADIGKSKVTAAEAYLRQFNPAITIHTYQTRLDTHNTLDIIRAYDIIIDGTDNFATRYMLNDACVLLNKPLVYGAVSQYQGQVAVFNTTTNGTNYRDLFPDPPAPGEVLNCEEAGVLGVLPGLIGTWQAAEAIKWITGIGEVLADRLLIYQLADASTYTINIARQDSMQKIVPRTEPAFRETNYVQLCNQAGTGSVNTIDSETIGTWLDQDGIIVVDVREHGELPDLRIPHLRIPLSTFNPVMIDGDRKKILFICQSGQRSKVAAQQLINSGFDKSRVFSLDGGIRDWAQQNQTPTV